MADFLPKLLIPYLAWHQEGNRGRGLCYQRLIVDSAQIRRAKRELYVSDAFAMRGWMLTGQEA